MRSLSLRDVRCAKGAAQAAAAPDPPAPSQDEQLHQVLTLLNVASRRLDQIRANWTPPPDDGKLTILALVADVHTHCAFIDGVATELERQTG